MNEASSPKLIDSIHVGISDSFVENSNKTGSGNGEAKLYLGHQNSPGFHEFFGSRGYVLSCKLYKKDLIRFMNESKPYYFNPPFQYRGGNSLKALWHERMKEINQFPSEIINIELKDQVQIDPPRSYAKSSDQGFNFLRSLPLSHISKLVVVKYELASKYVYDLKLILDVPQQVRNLDNSDYELLIREIQAGTEKNIGYEIERIKKQRIGQEKFRSRVLDDCKNTCAFTKVNERTFLIAGHIKPWSESDEIEKVDSQNGLAFTPTFDKLFNDGFISFTNEGKLLISPLLSTGTRKLLNLSPQQSVPIPISGSRNSKRREYLAYHRQNIFRT